MLLYDFGPTGGRTSSSGVRDWVPPAEQKRVLDKVFAGKKYLARKTACTIGIGDGTLDSAVERGQFAPSVGQGADGAFVSPGVAEKLFLVSVGECNASHADSWGTNRLVVLRGDDVVADIPVNGGQSLSRVVDLDGDGRAELLVTSGFTNQGSSVRSARVIRVEPSKVSEVESFGTVYEGNCANQLGDAKEEKYSIIRAQTCQGHAPEFTVQEKKGPC